VRLETQRLVLRPFAPTDLPAFVAYRSDPEIARYQGWDAGYSMADAMRFLEALEAASFGEPDEWSQLAIVDRASDALRGDCAMRFLSDPPATVEIGITIAGPHQGQGMASEALVALVDALFRDHDVHRVVANADDRNTAVQRLLERLGFRCEARFVEADWFKDEWTTLRAYATLEREWGAGAG
jgi:RimJ/RimL family protein N-acetyltransferase